MKKLHLLVVAILFVTISCTLDKTDYRSEIDTIVEEFFEFEEVVSFNESGYKISVEALNGTFYKGYNDIRVKITDIENGTTVPASEVTFLPVMTDGLGKTSSGPHLYDLIYNSTENYYTGYAVFTKESTISDSWVLYLSFTVNNQKFSVAKDILINEQLNKNLNMTAFTGNDGQDYLIALIAPQKPKIAENDLVAGIFKYVVPTTQPGNFPDPSQFTYIKVQNYTLLLDPRMPEPSMGNHSSPNNQDLTQQSDGLYYGVVRYTMTGNWTLNFILKSQSGQTVKGTPVSTEFTPGIEGAKSDLFINILF